MKSDPGSELHLIHRYHVRVIDQHRALSFSLDEADRPFMNALNIEQLPFGLHQLANRNLRDFWDGDLRVAMTSRQMVRGHFHVLGSFPKLLVDHLIVPDTRAAAPHGLTGWFSFSRPPTAADLGSETVDLRRYRRTRPISRDTSAAGKVWRRVFGSSVQTKGTVL